VALLLSYFKVRRDAMRQRDAVKGLAALQADLFYGDDIGSDGTNASMNVSSYDVKTGKAWGNPDTRPRVPAWLLHFAGDDYFRTLTAVSLATHTKIKVPPDVLRDLSKLDHLKSLNLEGAEDLEDGDLVHVGRTRSLQRLFVNSDEVTDLGIEHIGSLTNLEYLSLAGTKVSDDGLVHLAGLVNLKMLELGDTDVSDAAIKHLRKLQSLALLYLYGTRVTEKGADELRRALPKCSVVLYKDAFP
jgi:hypothetical protein